MDPTRLVLNTEVPNEGRPETEVAGRVASRDRPHRRWSVSEVTSKVPSMTSEAGSGQATTDTVEGGLDDPRDLEPEQGTLALAGPDDAHSGQEWEAAAAAVLRKARRLTDDDPDGDVWAKLTRTTLDGVELPPLGTPASLEDVETSGRPTRQGEWDIRAHHGRGPGDKAVNEDVLVDLEGGVTSLWLQVDPGTDWSALLDGVLLDLAPVVLQAADDDAVATAEAFLDHVGGAALHPGTGLGVPAHLATPALARRAAEHGVLGFVVDATTVHDRGASDAQELGWSIAVAAAYLRTLEAAGLAPDVAATLVEFRYAVTDEQFASLAKLRAANCSTPT